MSAPKEDDAGKRRRRCGASGHEDGEEATAAAVEIDEIKQNPSVGGGGEGHRDIYEGVFGPGSSNDPGSWLKSGPKPPPLVPGGATTRVQRPFGPGWSHDPGPKGLLAGRGENALAAHL